MSKRTVQPSQRSRGRRNLVASVSARRRYVLAGAILGALCGLALSFSLPANYEASVGVVIAPVAGAGQAAPASAEEAVTLAGQVVQSDEVRNAVRVELTAIAPPSPVIFRHDRGQSTATLAVRDHDPDLANRLVSGYAKAADAALRSSSGLSLGLVGEPTRPVDPIGPSPARLAGLGLGIGLILGLIAALVRDTRDDAVRPGVDIEGLTGLPVLASIPHLAATDSGHPISPRANRCDDSFRDLALNVDRLGGDRRLRIIQIVAPLEGTGATTVAAGLAVAASIAGRDIVLVDGDVRKPSQHEMLRLPAKPGLLAVVSASANTVTVHAMNRRLEVVTAGGVAPTPTEFLGSHAVGEVLDFLTENGELAILDTHGLFPRRDALAALRHVDGVILVVRSGRTTIPQLVASIEAIVAAGGRPLGVVLNRVRGRAYRGGRLRRHEGEPLVEVQTAPTGVTPGQEAGAPSAAPPDLGTTHGPQLAPPRARTNGAPPPPPPPQPLPAPEPPTPIPVESGPAASPTPPLEPAPSPSRPSPPPPPPPPPPPRPRSSVPPPPPPR